MAEEEERRRSFRLVEVGTADEPADAESSPDTEPTTLATVPPSRIAQARDTLKVEGERPKLPEYIQRMQFESLIHEATAAVRQEYFDKLWTSEFDGLSDIKLDAVANYVLVQICSQDADNYPTNYLAIKDEIKDLPSMAKKSMGLITLGFAWREMKRRKLTLRDRGTPFEPVPAEAMHINVRQDLEPYQKPPDKYGVIQVAQVLVQAVRRGRLCVMVIDGSPFMRSPYGGGKSQLLLQVLYWAYRELGKVFDPRKDVVYGKDQERALRMFREYDERVPWGIDEIDQFVEKREWGRPENKALIKALQLYRKAGRPIVGACGSLWNCDERIRHVIATHRLEITKWDDERFAGSASLYAKWGPPIMQDEKQDQWGRFDFPIEFNGLGRDYFKLYMACHDKTVETQDDGGLDAWLANNPDWRSEKPELLQT